MGTALFWMVPVASMLALVLAWYFYRQMMRESEGTPSMEKIASHVRRGAMSYLKQQQLRMLRHVQPMPHVHINLPRICLKAVKPDLPRSLFQHPSLPDSIRCAGSHRIAYRRIVFRLCACHLHGECRRCMG